MPDDIVRAYHAALGERDFETARGLLKDDLRFEGPFETFDRADDYLSALTRLWGIVERIEIRHRSSSGNATVVLYDMVTQTPAGTQLICEWSRVEDGRIAWIRTVFDTAPFAFLRPAS